MDTVRADSLDRRVWLNIRVTRAGLRAAQSAIAGAPAKVLP
jgi:hypothetical protein